MKTMFFALSLIIAGTCAYADDSLNGYRMKCGLVVNGKAQETIDAKVEVGELLAEYLSGSDHVVARFNPGQPESVYLSMRIGGHSSSISAPFKDEQKIEKGIRMRTPTLVSKSDGALVSTLDCTVSMRKE